MNPGLPLLALASLALIGDALPQQRGQDRRDRVLLTDGSVVDGRVAEPFATDEILIMQGGRRVRVPRAKVREMQLVRSTVAEFLERRLHAGNDAAASWTLVEWADAHELEALARLQALTVVFLDDDHDAAHQRLGHRRHAKKGWLWSDDGGWRTLQELEERHARWGRALELASEHFTVKTDAGMPRAVEALIDLERLYLVLLDELGPSLALAEALRPMSLHVWQNADEFPPWESERLPYFVPAPFEDAGHTYYRPGDDRPAALFELGTQMVLYRCLARDANPGGPQQRFCATAELGLARWMQSRMTGPPGRAAAGDPELAENEAWLALHGRRFGLENLLHLSLRDSFYGGFGDRPAISWASAHAFVAWLMDATTPTGHRDGFLTWLRLALAAGKGDSSSAFDDAFGAPIESLEQPFSLWLARRSEK